MEILVVNRTPYHSIRVRDYEADLSDTIVPLADVLDPVGVKHLQADVTDLDPANRTVACGQQELSYDRLVFALGSRLARPPIPGLQDHAFDVDTYEGAMRLNAHVAALPPRLLARPVHRADRRRRPDRHRSGHRDARQAARRRRACLRSASSSRTASPGSAPTWARAPSRSSPRPCKRSASRPASTPRSPPSTREGATLSTGERIEAATIVWCAGLLAHPLTARFPAARDRFGRLRSTTPSRSRARPAAFAAGDAAWFPIDGTHPTVMSCQHARPMGRFAGHNVVCDLLGSKMLPLRIDWYTTVLDLGPWGAVYTEGWDRHVVAQGEAAKRTKQIINRQRIYPPRTRDAREILAAAAPAVQAPPQR